MRTRVQWRLRGPERVLILCVIHRVTGVLSCSNFTVQPRSGRLCGCGWVGWCRKKGGRMRSKGIKWRKRRLIIGDR